MARYKRVLLKISGEALAGEQGFGIVPEAMLPICGEIIKLHQTGTQVAIVLGGGNIFRGLKGSLDGIDRVTGDYMGMLATVINGLALQDVLEKQGVATRLMSSIPIVELYEPFIRRRAIKYLETGFVVIFAGGTGNPFFSTDTAASLRAAQINADVIIKGTKVDGVYDRDPMKHPEAKKFDEISFSDVLSRGLKVMDATAIAMCRDNNIPIIVYDLARADALIELVNGKQVGTMVKEDING
jgi:uridylate kinase